MRKIILILLCIFAINSCADYKRDTSILKNEKKYFSSKGFVLIYNESLFKEDIISKKIKSDSIAVMHNSLKINTPILITNPTNLKTLETKIYKKAKYPKIFNLVVTEKVANILDLDIDNPYVEFNEIKKNKTFIAKKTNTFEEEKNVAEKVPVDEIKMDDLTSDKPSKNKTETKKYNFTILINDFYYEDSAINLKNEIIKKTNLNNVFVKKINDKKYRLLVGPFKNFNALKTTYISLNNLGFDDLNIYKN
tara:strand:+ start:7914 stop:8663 length:750 start_codon:yes stop_codon:yes gene_type:complete